MELNRRLKMFKSILEFFGIYAKEVKSEVTKVVEEVETEVKKEVEILKKSSHCGCGRSPTGSCLGLHKLSEEEWLVHEVNPNRIVAAVKDEVKKVKKAATDELKEVEKKIEDAINDTVAEIKKVKKSKAKKA